MLDPTLPIVLSGLTVVSVLRYSRWRLGLWEDAVKSCGLRVVESTGIWSFRIRIKARDGPLEVRIQDSRRKHVGTRIEVSFPGPPGFSAVRIRRKTFGEWMRDVEVGDPPFDDTFFVAGLPELVFPLLDAEARRLLASANAECPVELVQGRIEAELRDPQTTLVLVLLHELCRWLARPFDMAQRLAENAREDPVAEVRLRNLLVLVRGLPGDPRTKEALRAACSDSAPQNRLRAAQELGAEGRPVLLEIAASQEDDALGAKALAILGGDVPFERTRSILIGALRRRRLRTASACLEALGRSGAAEAVAVLAKVAAREKGELGVVAALALGEAGNADAEPALLKALQHEAVRVAAATSLGRVGTVAAVLPLKETAEAADDPELRRVARQAIAEIQSRLPGASPGQLSLDGAEAGRLSLAGVEAGQLSLAQAEAGQLALATDTAGELSLSGAGDGPKPEPRQG